MTKQTKLTTIKVEKALHTRTKTWCAMNHTNVNALLVSLLEKHMKGKRVR